MWRHSRGLFVWIPLVIATACGGQEGTVDAAMGSHLKPREMDRAQEDSLRYCAFGETVAGIDVSKWNGNVDWGSVASSGIDFAFIRVSDGTGHIDQRFAENWANAKAEGVRRGAYQFFRAHQSATAQADILLDRMGDLEAGDLPPVIDVESTNGVSPSVIASNIRTWIDRVEGALGVKPIIYTGKYFWQDNVRSDAFSDYPLWIANWGVTCPNTPNQWTDWTFWQTSETGAVDGVPGNVDTNEFNGGLLELEAFARGVVCGDGVCGAGETSDNCRGDCLPCETLPAYGGVIDDDDACFEFGGNPQYVREVTGSGHGGGLKWTKTWRSESSENFGQWKLRVARPGLYQIEAYTDAEYARWESAPYRVWHAGTTDVVTVDQTAVDGWNGLGAFYLGMGRDQRIRVEDAVSSSTESGLQFVLDAIRLTPLSESPCGDGVCGVDQDNAVCPADCLPCDVVPAEGRIIDDDDACFIAGGTLDSTRQVQGSGYGDGLKWTRTWASAIPDNFGHWTLRFAVDGVYRVEIYAETEYAEWKLAPYMVRHNALTERVTVDQAAADGWVSLGVFDFSAGDGQWIRIEDIVTSPNDSHLQFVLDAVRITPAY